MTETQSSDEQPDNANNDGATAASLLPAGVVFQISMRSILLTMAGLALMIGAVFSFPPLLSAALAALLSLSLPPALVATAIYGNYKWRAFAIGMLTPTALRLFGHAPLGSSVAMMSAMSAWQSYPPLGSGVMPTDSDGYFTRLAGSWAQVGHALMAEETLFWLVSFAAGLIALAVQRHFARNSLTR